MKCPKCGAEVEYFIKRRPRDPYLQCPVCGAVFKKSDLPPEERDKIKIKYIHEEDSDKDGEGDGGRVDEAEVKEEQIETEEPKDQEQPPAKAVAKTRRYEPLFEAPKEPAEVIAEILLDWGCKEDFVKRVTEYINVKGYFDAGWLMTMLLKANTGRRFTEQEAFMVVDLIMSALERERKKAEEMGRSYPLGIVPLPSRGSGSGTYYSQLIPLQTTPQYTPQYQQTYHGTSQPPQVAQAPQYQQASQVITPQMIQEMIRQAMSEQKKADTIEELKKMIYELEKKRIEDKSEFEKKVADLDKTLEEKITKKVEESLREIKDMIASLTPAQSQPQSTIDKKDLELIRMELEKNYIQKLTELEKKLLESKTEAEKKELISQIQELRNKLEEVEKSARPLSPEGWQSDEARLVAELGGRLFEILKDRKPVEYLVKVIPQKPQTPIEKKTESSIEELIKESGGVVE